MTVHTITLSAFIQRMATLGGDVEAAVVRGLQSAAMRLDGRVVHEIDHADPHPAVDRSELRNSVEVVPTDKGAIVKVTAPHAKIINDGTRPFWPPLQPLIDWLTRKQLVPEEEIPMRARMIQRAIAARGIAPRHYFDKAFAWLVRSKVVGREVGHELEALAIARGKGRVGTEKRRGSGLRRKGGA